jgi:uncharacterized protein YycO
VIRARFVLGKDLSSQAIAWFSAGHFSHVDAVMPDGGLLGSRADRVTVGGVTFPTGVQVRPPSYEPVKEAVELQLAVTVDQAAKFYAFLYSQIGRPYDKTAIWGFATGRDWREQDSWFCSELITAGFEEAGVVPTLYTPRNKVTPAACALVMSAVGATAC